MNFDQSLLYCFTSYISKQHSYQTWKVLHIKKAFFPSKSKRKFFLILSPIFIKPSFYFIFPKITGHLFPYKVNKFKKRESTLRSLKHFILELKTVCPIAILNKILNPSLIVLFFECNGSDLPTSM